jgi:hypothetical protein
MSAGQLQQPIGDWISHEALAMMMTATDACTPAPSKWWL